MIRLDQKPLKFCFKGSGFPEPVKGVLWHSFINE